MATGSSSSKAAAATTPTATWARSASAGSAGTSRRPPSSCARPAARSPTSSSSARTSPPSSPPRRAVAAAARCRRPPWLLALLLPLQAALSLVRSLRSLAAFSILADACTVLAVATVVKQDLQLLAARGEPPFAGRTAVAGPWGVAFAAGFAVFCFEGFCMTLALEASMADRRRFRPALLQAIAGVTAVYVCFGACGYLAYGDATTDIITLNLPRGWPTAAVKVALCVALALTFPVMMHPIHEIVEARVLPPGGWLRRRGAAAERAALHASRVAVLATLSAVACFVPAFGSFASFVGSTVCALLSFVLPALFHLRVAGAGAGAGQRALDWAILLFGLAFAAHGLYAVV
ncbi:hypothetical protein BS78_K027900 [Paspalum vaginatum]|uniref:Amino acid transporter transmembrane domain-containing protein n=1 Tax=Paspalum vaginatum TaxID=158149 RepID=A0A9W7XA50_9POAL|nr:hypothetical protein BS78_K027900 [Paspalum vaginatum]